MAGFLLEREKGEIQYSPEFAPGWEYAKIKTPFDGNVRAVVTKSRYDKRHFDAIFILPPNSSMINITVNPKGKLGRLEFNEGTIELFCKTTDNELGYLIRIPQKSEIYIKDGYKYTFINGIGVCSLGNEAAATHSFEMRNK